MFSKVYDLLYAGEQLEDQHSYDLGMLKYDLRQRLSGYVSGSSLDLFCDWVDRSESYGDLWVIKEALENETMPSDAIALTGHLDESDPEIIIGYVSIAHLLTGREYPMDVVLGILRGIKDSYAFDMKTDEGQQNAAVITTFMIGVRGTPLVAEGTFDTTYKMLLFARNVSDLVLEHPDRVEDIIRFSLERRRSHHNDEAGEIAAKDPSNVEGVLNVIALKNEQLGEMVREMIESDHGVLVDGML